MKKTPNQRKQQHARKHEQQQRDKIIGSTHERTFQVERLAGDKPDSVKFAASLSSEQPVRRFFGDEILVHSKDAINMERANNGLSLLLNHDVDRLLGRVSGIRLDSGRLRGDLEFDNEDADGAAWQSRVERGFAGDVSIRYSIDDYEIIERKDQEPEYRVTRWTPLEVSVVTVPADHSVGVGRSNQEGKTMPTKKDDDKSVDDPKENGGNVVSFESGRSKGKLEGVQAERERIASIGDFFASSRYQGDEFDALKRECIEQGVSYDTAVERWAHLVNQMDSPQQPARPQGGQDRQADITGGDDAADKLIAAGTRAVMFRGGLLSNEEKADRDKVRQEMRENPYTGLTMGEMARECLRAAGIDTMRMDKGEVIAAALNPSSIGRRDLVGHGTSAFTNILADTANKALGMGYVEAPEVWDQIVRPGRLEDFREADRPNISSFSDLDTIVEGGEYKHGTLSDKKEVIQAAKKGKLFAITREALINDDLSAFTRIPRMMGIAANRAVGDVVFALLTSPPTMNEDATSLFRASNTGTAGAPSTTTWEEVEKEMALQTDPNGNAILNIMPSIAIVPKAHKRAALVLARAGVNPVGDTNAKGGAVEPNIYQGVFSVVSDGRLDANSTDKWYASADPNVWDTIEVGFVQGRREPYLESRDGWSVDGIEYKVRHEFGAAVLDFRGLYYNAGA